MAIKGTRSERSWMIDVGQLLRTRWQAGDQFTLAEVYEFIPKLQEMRPDSANIHNTDKVQTRVRDALQQLRHHRKIEFVGSGSYRLL